MHYYKHNGNHIFEISMAENKFYALSKIEFLYNQADKKLVISVYENKNVSIPECIPGYISSFSSKKNLLSN